METQIKTGDCLEVLQSYSNDFFDLIITSPPYADSRSHTYGGIKPAKYVKWFLPRAKEFFRVLKPEGSFVLNIKERVVSGERSTYVLELILAMKKQGWVWTEEFIWHKKNCHPGKWPNRFRDAWERCLQFNKQKNFKMNQESVMLPTGDWAKNRLKNLGKNFQFFLIPFLWFAIFSTVVFSDSFALSKSIFSSQSLTAMEILSDFT